VLKEYIYGIMQPWRESSFALRGDSAAAGSGQPADHPTSEIETGEDHAILCGACGAQISSVQHRIEVHGSHDHRFINPAGLLFHIGCFAEAVGCRIVGPDSVEYPWFPGFAWRYAMCGSCGQHLGWHFRSDGKPSFFGLVLDRLIQPGSDA
jgi:hypothetical protein